MSPGPKPGHGPTSPNSALGHDSTGLTSNSRSVLVCYVVTLSHGINSRQGALFLLTVLTSPCPASLLCLATNFQLSPSSAGARLGPVLSTVTAAGLEGYLGSLLVTTDTGPAVSVCCRPRSPHRQHSNYFLNRHKIFPRTRPHHGQF